MRASATGAIGSTGRRRRPLSCRRARGSDLFLADPFPVQPAAGPSGAAPRWPVTDVVELVGPGVEELLRSDVEELRAPPSSNVLAAASLSPSHRKATPDLRRIGTPERPHLARRDCPRNTALRQKPCNTETRSARDGFHGGWGAQRGDTSFFRRLFRDRNQIHQRFPHYIERRPRWRTPTVVLVERAITVLFMTHLK